MVPVDFRSLRRWDSPPKANFAGATNYAEANVEEGFDASLSVTLGDSGSSISGSFRGGPGAGFNVSVGKQHHLVLASPAPADVADDVVDSVDELNRLINAKIKRHFLDCP